MGPLCAPLFGSLTKEGARGVPCVRLLQMLIAHGADRAKENGKWVRPPLRAPPPPLQTSVAALDLVPPGTKCCFRLLPPESRLLVPVLSGGSP